jgi:tRNA1Val (adenine37-N6)-methyltransferase
VDNPFHFKEFTVVQEHAAMKVGTDSVLLGAWVTVEKPNFILDIGSGTGLLCLMMAQRFPKASILGIEMEEDAILDATHNIDNSKWKGRIYLLKSDFLKYPFSTLFDLILTNPPYFPSDSLSPIKKRSLARNGIEFSFIHWLVKAKDLLTPNGVIAFILPIIQWENIKGKLKDHDLYILRIRKVKPKQYKEAHRILVEVVTNKSKRIEEDVLVIENEKRHDYSNAYKELTKPFYL